MRVGIVALMHESNTFIRGTTTLADFEADLLLEGEPVRHKLADAHHEIGGFFEGLSAAGIDAVPVFAARALPYGPIAAETATTLVDRLLRAVDGAGRLDGLLVAPHGAAVADNEPDFDGFWLEKVARHVGTGVPVIGTIDLHANVSPRMVGACDAIVAYRENPHLDQRARGREAADLMARFLTGEVWPVMAAAFPPLAVNILQQATAESPCRELYARADTFRKRRGVLSVSLALGFPYADVAEMGASVLVVTDGDAAVAARHAAELAGEWWARRTDFDAKPIDAATAVKRAAELDGPVCLLDTGDNVGGGSPGDGTLLAHELRRQKLGTAFVCLADADAVRQARATGINARVHLRVGGKYDDRHGEPLDAEFVVRGLFDGRFTEPEPRHGGITTFDQGPTAVLETDERLTVMVTTRRMAPFSLQQLTSCGLRPEAFQVLTAKGVHAPVAAYGPVCKHLIRIGTPGVTAADLSAFEYRHRRRPMFPFEPETIWNP
ncbi:MAG TPA: M81 family metallopeptidase [Gemmataceae bacterium]|nr:M81 family metallopeptidase [Gemmataceae bacterium]